MRSPKPVLAGVLGLVAVAACGLPPTTRDGAPVRVAGPTDPARRYQVLETNPLCTPTPTGTGTGTPSTTPSTSPSPGDCTAIGARDNIFFMLLVDRTPSDIGQVSFSDGNIQYLALGPSVTLGTNGFGNPEATINANFDGTWTGPPEEEPEEIEQILITFTLDLVTGSYSADSDDNTYDNQGTMTIVIARPGQCTLIPVADLFPPG